MQFIPGGLSTAFNLHMYGAPLSHLDRGMRADIRVDKTDSGTGVTGEILYGRTSVPSMNVTATLDWEQLTDSYLGLSLTVVNTDST